MNPSFEFLKNCKPGELLRVKIEDVAEFAILGASEGHGLQPLVVLKNDEPPYAINLLEKGHCRTILTDVRLVLVRSSKKWAHCLSPMVQNHWRSKQKRGAEPLDIST